MFNGILRTLFIAILVCLSACQPESISTPAVETPASSSTIPPTLVQITFTSIPAANFTPQDLLGIWTRSDPERGQLFLVFKENGTYFASHGDPDTVVHSGDYSLDDRVFTFINGWDCADAPGLYVIRLTGGGKYLLFEPLEDKCSDRPGSVKSYRWDKVEAVTPTP